MSYCQRSYQRDDAIELGSVHCYGTRETLWLVCITESPINLRHAGTDTIATYQNYHQGPIMAQSSSSHETNLDELTYAPKLYHDLKKWCTAWYNCLATFQCCDGGGDCNAAVNRRFLLLTPILAQEGFCLKGQIDLEASKNFAGHFFFADSQFYF